MTIEAESSQLGKRADALRAWPRKPSRLAVTTVVASVAGFAALALWWNSHRPENCYARGRRALLSGDRQAVLRESGRLIRTPGFEPQGRLLAGLLFAQAGRPIEALQELELAARSESTAVEAMTAAAKCYYISDRYIEAINMARATLARDGEALDARRWLAAAYYDLGAVADASAELAIIAANAPDDPRPERLLGLIDKDNERFAEAAGHYRESLRRQEQQPDSQMILVELAESLVRLSHFDEALQTLQKCDRTPRALTLEAECDECLGRIDDALARLCEALELDPEYIPANLKRGTLLLLLGRADEAAGALECTVHLAPSNSLAHFQLSQAYARQGEFEKSDEQMRHFREIQQIERQFTDLHEVASQKIHDPDVRYRLGVMARRLDKPRLARLWFRAALALEPKHSVARTALEEPDAPHGSP